MNHLFNNYDCAGHPAEADIHDIGILASTDPPALNQTCKIQFMFQKGDAPVNCIE